MDCKLRYPPILQRLYASTLIQIKNLHFVLLELCDRPDYVDLIRAEIEHQEKLDYTTVSSLPILDSFIKESARLNPLDLCKFCPQL